MTQADGRWATSASSRPATPAAATGDATGEAPSGEQSGSVVTYFEAKGFGFLRPDDGGRDIFFHVSRLSEGLATDLRPGTRVLYELRPWTEDRQDGGQQPA